MRLQQLRSLDESELGLLLYVMNDFGTRQVEVSTVEELSWFKNDAILWKLSQAEAKLNEQGKLVFQELMRKLNTSSHQEAIEFAEADKPEYTQLEFQF